jgi:predicted RNA-binding Zn ribbon-like protein
MSTSDIATQSDESWDPLDPGGVPSLIGRYAADRLPLLGGALCLDFTNTAVWRMRPEPDETLVTYDDLLRWAARAGAIDDQTAAILRRAADAAPAAAARTVAQAKALREALYRIVLAAMAGVAPDPAPLETFNRELQGAMARAGVHPGPDGLQWDWPLPADAVEFAQPLWPVVRSAADLLTGTSLDRVKRCPGEGCGWLFLDTSRNGSRRWCSMESCGNRARVRAFAARQRGTTP